MTSRAKKDWPADKVERRPLDSLIPYARNARTHSDEQVAQIAASMREWGWTNPVLIDEDGGIIAGHGRVLAARKLGFDEVPVMVARGWSEAQRRAYVIADNQLALRAGWDMPMLAGELHSLNGEGFELGLLGFEVGELTELMYGEGGTDGEGGSEEASNYSRKIEAPIYEITGECPKAAELFDRVKADKLIAEINGAELPPEVAQFLRFAAERHVVFNFRNIAEFYAHANEETQSLMERSALVIIDFDKAIEEGFVKLTEAVADQYVKDYPDEE